MRDAGYGMQDETVGKRIGSENRPGSVLSAPLHPRLRISGHPTYIPQPRISFPQPRIPHPASRQIVLFLPFTCPADLGKIPPALTLLAPDRRAVAFTGATCRGK